jgi:peroxiredoxin
MKIAGSMKEATPAGLGARLPKVTLADRNGASVDLASLALKGPTLLILFRGGWCPYCSVQMGGLKKAEDQLVAAGVQLVGISTDSVVTMRSHSETFRPKFPLLSDPMLAVAKALGVAYRVADAELAILRGAGLELAKLQGSTENLLPVPSAFLFSPGGLLTWRFTSPDVATRIDSGELLIQVRAVLPKRAA